MEYCEKIVNDVWKRKRIIRFLCVAIAMVFIVGTAYELPELELKEADVEMLYEEGTGAKYQSSGDELIWGNTSDTVFQNLEGIEIPRKTLDKGIVSLKEQGFSIGLESYVMREAQEWSGPLTEMDIPYNSSVGFEGIIQVPEKDKVQEIPSNNIEPTSPEDSVIPNVPETIVPDEEIPDIPAEVIPDTAADGETVITIPGFQINEAGMIYDFIPEEAEIESGGYLQLPSEGATGVLKGAFEGVGNEIGDIEIPANITYIEDGAFADLPELYSIWVEEGNANYASVDGVLFDSSMTSILAFPTGRIGTYEVPGYITRFADYSFANTHLDQLEMRACQLMEVGTVAFGEGGTEGLIISAPRDYLEDYQNIFAGFPVVVQ